MISRRKRIRHLGTTMAEAPLALWIIILAIAFPLIILVMMSVRFAFFWNAARDACNQACQAPTFQVNPPSGGQSACTIAQNVALAATSAFSGISLTNTEVYIIRTELATGNAVKLSVPNQRLMAPADPEQYYYSIQVELNGNLEPFLSHPGFHDIVSIPGLTASYPIKVSSQLPFENVQGLDD